MPFQKGKSGNPGGRPKGSISLTSIVLRKLRQTRTLPSGERRKEADLIMEAILAAARAGEHWACKLLWERLEGKMPETINTNITSPLPLRIVMTDDDGMETEEK